MTAATPDRNETGHPVVAVVDKRAGATVLWHVQTAPDAPAGLLSGAWILSGDDVDPERLADLLRDTVVLPVGETDPGGHPATSLGRVHEAVGEEMARLRAHGKAQQETNKSLKLPRFDALVAPDTVELAESFRGEESAREAWSHATALADLVEQWHGVEAQRRSRKYLQEQFGAEVRPLPLGN